MPTNYSGAATDHADIPVPNNADVPSGGLFATPLARLLDKLLYWILRIITLEGASPGIVAPDKVVVFPVTAPHLIGPAGQFGPSVAGIGFEQKLVAFAGQMSFNAQLAPFRVGRIKAVSLVVQGGAGHGGVLPTTKPAFSLDAIDTVGVVFTNVAAATDAPASAAAYELAHAFGVTGLTHFIDPARRYQCVVTGEVGGSAIAGLQIAELRVTIGP